MTEIKLAHSELTNTIYALIGKEKIDITEQAIAEVKAIKALKELQAHKEAWAKLREDIKDESEFAFADFDKYKYEVLGIDDVDDLPYDDYRYGMERALELIDIYRPKEDL